MAITPVKVGVIGCGNISGIYLKNMTASPVLDVVACADLFVERAQERAKEYGVPRACTTEELLADPEIELVLNLTIPQGHATIALAALEQGKSVYNEKPLAITRDDGRRIIETARAKGLLVGCAPDTFLGAGLQTCRQLIDEGAIGEPIGAVAFMMSHGPESWHPDPAFFYQVGAGPMFDMGPYYLTALISLIGPVRRVTGSTRITFPERTITSQPKHGQVVKVETPTHISGLLDFANGAVATITTSFDVWGTHLPNIEIYGADGSLSVPDPNNFGGRILVQRGGTREWTEVPLTHPYVENSRGIGVEDMAYALRMGKPHRASGEMAYHVLDIMHAFDEASRSGTHIALASTCARPAPLPPNSTIAQAWQA